MAIRVDINGDGIWDKEFNDPSVVLPAITDETGDGILDVNITAAFSSAIIDGAIFTDAFNVGSGTGGYNTFLAIQDQTGGESPQDLYEQGFNSNDKNPLNATNDEIDGSKTHTVLLGAVPIQIINGIAYYEFRVDLNESNSAPDTNISLDQFRLYTTTNGAIESTLDLFDTTAGDGDPAVTSLRYDMDANNDVSVLLSEANSSGSGTDDYAVLVPVTNFAGLDPATTYLYLWVQMGNADGPANGPTNSWITDGGFEEWNLQDAVIIQGTKFNDIDGDGVKDAGEGGVPNVTIYIDDNLDGIVDATDNNGVLDVLAGEQFDITDANGNYSFGGIPVGEVDYTINIREVVPAGSVPTTPLPVQVVIDSSFAAGTIITTTTVPGLLIGNRLLTPSISLTKSASVPGDCANVVGELITYTIVVDNDGDLTLTNVVLTDNFEGGGNLTITPVPDDGDGILELGEVWLSGDANGNNQMETTETWTYTYVRAVTQAQIDSNGGGNGTLTDVATVNASSANGSVTDNDDATVAVCQEPAMNVTKSVVSVTNGDDNGTPLDLTDDLVDGEDNVINYSITIANTGNVRLSNVTVEDEVESYGAVAATYVSGDANTDGFLDVGETWTYSASYDVTQADIDNNGGGDGFIDNVATGDTDETPEDTDDASVGILLAPSMNVTKSVVSVTNGDDNGTPLDLTDDLVDGEDNVINYSITIANTGNVRLSNVTVEDEVESYGAVAATYVSGDANTDGFLDVGETWTYSASYDVTQADIDNNGGGDGFIDNVATGDTDETPEDTDDASVGIIRNPAITIEKSVKTDVNNVYADADAPDGLEASTSSTVNFRVVLTNTGNVTLTAITLSDSVVHTVNGIPQVAVPIDYADPALNAFIDLNGNGTLDADLNGSGFLDAGDEEWLAFDTNGDGTLDIDENGDPFELSVGESVSIYYSLASQLGQHENTATVDTAETGPSSDDANYYVLPSEECVGVRTPGFWSRDSGSGGWSTFWDGIVGNEPKQAGTPGFADGELLYAVDSDGVGGVDAFVDANNDGVSDNAGLLIGDYNQNGITDAGEDTIFISLANAKTLINASQKAQQDGIYMLGRDVVATWLNYLANNQEDIGNCIGDDILGTDYSPEEFLNSAIDWFQEFASNKNPGIGSDATNAIFQFDAPIKTNHANWKSPVSDVSVHSAAAMHSALDGYNNTGAIWNPDSQMFEEYCCDADSSVALHALTQLQSDYFV